jgi:Xaa-Pro aminopeptidase
MVPVQEYLRIKGLFSGTRVEDISGAIRNLRKIKSPFEVSLMRKAGLIAKEVYEAGAFLLKAGMTEIEFAGLLEAEAKKRGHEGLLRVRSINYEAYSWHVLSGTSGGIVSQSDSPMGGLGLSPAFPVGAGRRIIKANEPVLVDFGVCYHGYQADQTRMFCIGKMPGKFADAYFACKEIHDTLIQAARPGMDCEGLFLETVKTAGRLGKGDIYLGPPGLQTRFVGHGIGLELNELPFIALGQRYALETGMTFALEPKMVFAGEGAVGIENTAVVTEKGCEILTPIKEAIFEV